MAYIKGSWIDREFAGHEDLIIMIDTEVIPSAHSVSHVDPIISIKNDHLDDRRFPWYTSSESHGIRQSEYDDPDRDILL